MLHDHDTTLRFLRVVMPPGTVLELRAFQSRFLPGGNIGPANTNSTLAGWYDNPLSLVVDACKARGVSVYTTFNPVDPDLLARSCNKLNKVKHATRDEDILSLEWLFIDVDPVRKADISSTNAELALALGRRDAILAGVPGLAETCLTGSSGNGAYILAKINSLPSDADGKATVANALAILSAIHSDAAVKVDVTTKNPARVCCVPGTVKTKGSSTADRPWRLATLEATPAEGAAFDLAAFVEANRDRLPKDEGRAAKPGRIPRAASLPPLGGSGITISAGDFPREEKLRRAIAWIATKDASIAGTGTGQGSNKCIEVACEIGPGFGLDFDDALHVMLNEGGWNAKCKPEWSEYDLRHKLQDAFAKEGWRAGWKLAEQRQAPAKVKHATDEDREMAEYETAMVAGQEANPHRLAGLFLRGQHNHEDGYTIRFWQDEFHAWIDGKYQPVSGKEVSSKLSHLCNQEFQRVYEQQMMVWSAQNEGQGEEQSNDGGAEGGKKGKAPRLLDVSSNLVTNVKLAVAGECLLPKSEVPGQPCWIEGNGVIPDWPTHELVPMRNAIVHLPSFVAGQRCTTPPTPRLFTANVADYDWTPEAPEPIRWLEFLGARPIAPGSPIRYQVWDDDPEQIDCLQEWFGLNLVPDTQYQKMVALIGPKRSGKGTIACVLSQLLGSGNFVGPTLTGLSERFGLEPLIGKLAAVIDDARLSPKSDHAIIAERLLSISGEGFLTIDRKNRSAWSGVLSSRITMLSNEMPQLADNSNALTDRFIILQFKKSFFGNEDPKLKGILLEELPGILLWAIRGWHRLRERGHLIQPQSGLEMKEEMRDLSSPIEKFVKERCVIDRDATAKKEDLFRAWQEWCTTNGKKESGMLSVFLRNLRSVVPGIHSHQYREGKERSRATRGIRLLTPGEMAEQSDDPESPESQESLEADRQLFAGGNENYVPY